ncbi:MAG: GNAT family N-acetyltransferase [Lachnospirales bacterium]
MEIELLSNAFHVRKLGTEDVERIYDLCCENKIFYQFHPPLVTRESILEDMHALPPGKDYNDKFYIGFFENKILVAIMDLILDYPEKGIAYIGLFMMNLGYQNKGVGSEIIKECSIYLKKIGCRIIRLGVDRSNPQSHAFWKKNGFITIGENEYILMELVL